MHTHTHTHTAVYGQLAELWTPNGWGSECDVMVTLYPSCTIFAVPHLANFRVGHLLFFQVPQHFLLLIAEAHFVGIQVDSQQLARLHAR